MRFYAPAQIHEGLETEFFNLLLAEPVSNSLSFHERLHLWRESERDVSPIVLSVFKVIEEQLFKYCELNEKQE